MRYLFTPEDLQGIKTKKNYNELYKEKLDGYTTHAVIVDETIIYEHSVDIKNVIFNPPATIVMWTDGTKTVVKTQYGENFDPEKGLAMAISKKVMGNKGNYYNEFKKWTESYSNLLKNVEEFGQCLSVSFKEAVENFRKIFGNGNDV